jgi:pectate lyase
MQHNGAGEDRIPIFWVCNLTGACLGTVAVKNFYATDVGKVYRSCGNCDDMYERHSTFDNIYVDGADVVAGVNGNFGDTTDITNSCLVDSDICWLYEGNDDGDEPTKTASAPDGSTCATSGVSVDSC